MGIVEVCFSIWVHNASIVCDVIGTIGILYHDVGIVMGIPSHNIKFKGAM